MKKLLFMFLLIAFLIIIPSSAPAHAAVTFGGGYYTNLCGSGSGGLVDTCNMGCDPASGSCTSDKPYVVRYSCEGNQVSCRTNASKLDKTQSVTGAACGQTVELDVYKKNCQTVFGWFCNDTDRLDYMTWYSGDCTGQSTTTRMPNLTTTPPPSSGNCTNLSVTAGNNGKIPATVTLQATGADSGGTVADYMFYFGDGQMEETAQSRVTHQYQTSGSFTPRVFVKGAGGNWITSPSCQTKVTVTGSALETQKSACSNLFILTGNYTQAPANVTFQVTGYDNKGGVNNYRVDLGNGQVKDSATDTITAYYPVAGTYTVRGYIKDSQNNWQGTNETCTRTLYVTTQPLTQQPGTGTPTIYSIIALICGMTGFTLVMTQVPSVLKTPSNHRKNHHRKA